MGTELIDDEPISKIMTFERYSQEYEGWGRYTLKRGFYGQNADGERLVAFMAFTDGDDKSMHAYFTKEELRIIAMHIMVNIL
jgi:hypothetical protein